MMRASPTRDIDSHGTSRQRGVTVLEVVVAITFLLPVLGGIVTLTSGLTRTIDTQTTSCQTQALLQRTFHALATFVQTAKMSTLRMAAVQDDVTVGAASYVGEWIDPSELVWRPGVEFLSASGLLSMNARLSSATRRVVFTLDPGEVANGSDDDGDGLIDQGTITLLHEAVEVAVVRDVELCEFELDGRLLRMRIAIARRAGDGRIDRARMERAVYLRNN